MLLLLTPALASYQARCSAEILVTTVEVLSEEVSYVTGTVRHSSGPSSCRPEDEHTFGVWRTPPPEVGHIAILRIHYSDGLPVVDGEPVQSRFSTVVEHYAPPERCDVEAELIRWDNPTRYGFLARTPATAVGCPGEPHGHVRMEPEPWMRVRDRYTFEMTDDTWRLTSEREPNTCRMVVNDVAGGLVRPYDPTLACEMDYGQSINVRLGWKPGLPEAPFEVERIDGVWRVGDIVWDEPGRSGGCYVVGTVVALEGHVATIEKDDPLKCESGVDVLVHGDAEVGGRYLFELPQTDAGRPWAVERAVE